VIDGTGRDSADRGSHDALLVSACLLGVRCNHEGADNRSEAVVALGATHRLVPVCPETAGGLPTPRTRAERGDDGRVRTEDGTDVTASFERGAAHSVRLALAVGAQRAVLKARSPSCGCGRVYDGSFSKTLVDGDGVTAERLKEAGLDVVTEESLG
jgi:uncharacterized protein YbbK (DUF523 family)